MSILDQFRLDGKRALVTGGSKGLGLAMAKALAEVGADLVLVSRDQANLDAARETLAPIGRKIDILTGDLFTSEGVETMCQQVLADYGPIHILINNVGGRRENIPLLEQTAEDWKRLMDLNLTSAFLCTKLIGAPMVERKHGRIINIGSICGQVGTKNMHGRHYETAKAALAGFTRSVGADWAPYNVTVNTIAPGGFMTDANRRWFSEKPELQKKIEDMIPMARLGEPDEIGGLAVYLASDASSYMTGAFLVIDGGYTLW